MKKPREQLRDRFQALALAWLRSARLGACKCRTGGYVDLNDSIERAVFTAIDTELTGLDFKNDSIISIGAMRMVGGRIDLGDVFYRLIRPRSRLTAESIVIHGITPSDLAEEPAIDEVLPEFIEFLGKDTVVGYLPSIDMSFINREAKMLYGFEVNNPVIDISTAYRWVKWRTGDDYLGNPNLYEIAAILNVPVKDAHNALSDAFIAAQVLQRLMPSLLKLGIKSVGELLNVSNPAKGGEKFLSSSGINGF